LLIGGKYEVSRVLGEGGMGVVYLARHVDLGRSVAVKVLRADALRDPQAVERFRREARVAASLKSGHVARILDFGTLEDGAPFMVMEHLDGSDLDGELVRRGALPVAEAAGYILQACEAIKEAHQLGVVHRDLKPGNIFLANDRGARVAKVLDFGISKLVADQNVRMTQTQSSFGTPLYMSPEHMRSVKNVDHRTDIWSLGVILYEAVTGRVPFEADTATAVAVAVATEPLVPPSHHRPGLPPELDAVVARALEKDPARRYQSIEELAEGLKPLGQWGGALAPMARRPNAIAAETSAALTTGRVASPGQRRTFGVLYVAAAVLVGAGLGAAVYFRAAPSPAVSNGASPTQATTGPLIDATSEPSTTAKLAVVEPSPTVSPSVTASATATAATSSAAGGRPVVRGPTKASSAPVAPSVKPPVAPPPAPKAGGENPLLL
jgi:serine/threonine-protein kinase